MTPEKTQTLMLNSTLNQGMCVDEVSRAREKCASVVRTVPCSVFTWSTNRFVQEPEINMNIFYVHKFSVCSPVVLHLDVNEAAPVTSKTTRRALIAIFLLPSTTRPTPRKVEQLGAGSP